MTFLEKKREGGFVYEVEDVFGKITIDSPIKLAKVEIKDGVERVNGDILDGLVLHILKENKVEGLINKVIKYIYEPAKPWDKDSEVEGALPGE